MLGGSSLLTERQLFDWFCLLASVGLAAYLVIRFVRRERAGRILLDLGRVNEARSGQLLATGWMQIALGVGGAFASDHGFLWSYFVFFTLSGASTLVTATQRVLICEAGILGIGRLRQEKLFRWKDIRSYDLDKGVLRLNLREKGWTNCSRRIPLAYQEDLDAFMASRCRKLEPTAA